MIPLAFILALIAVESGGNDRAVGDHGQALGCLQIHRKVVADVNRIAKTRFKHEDAYNRNISIIMCRVYLNHHCGKDASFETMARVWNGGPKGVSNPKTDAYWAKVRQHLLSMRTLILTAAALALLAVVSLLTLIANGLQHDDEDRWDDD